MRKVGPRPVILLFPKLCVYLLATVLQLANRLLQHTGIARYVQNLRQCNSFLFTQFYEALTGSKVPGKMAASFP